MEGIKELRCRGRLQARIVDKTTIEVKCSSRLCGAGAGAVILHRFDTNTGELKATLRFRDPVGEKR